MQYSEKTPELQEFVNNAIINLSTECRNTRWSPLEAIAIEGVFWFLRARGIRFKVLPKDNSVEERVHELFNSIMALSKAVINVAGEEIAMFKDPKFLSFSTGDADKDNLFHEVAIAANDARLLSTYKLCDSILKKVASLPEENSLPYCDFADSLNCCEINEMAAAELFLGSLSIRYQGSDLLDKAGNAYYHPNLLLLIDYFLGDSKKGEILDPFCGLSLTSMISVINRGTYYGCEFNEETYNIGCLYASMLGIDIKNIKHCLPETGFNKIFKGQHFNAIVSIPPLGMRLPDSVSKKAHLLPEWFLSNSINYIDCNGVIAGIFPANIISSEASQNRKMRQALTEDNFIDTVVLLPAKLFKSTTLTTVLVVLKKGRDIQAPIRFIDASSFVKPSSRNFNIIQIEELLEAVKSKDKTIVTYASREEIAICDYLWMPNLYAKKQEQIEEGNKLVFLKDLVSYEKPKIEKPIGNKIVSISQLCKDKYDCVLDIDCLDGSINERGLYYKIDHPVLLVSSFLPLKPTLCLASVDHPVYVFREIFSFNINTALVDPSYLAYSLNSVPDTWFQGGFLRRVGRVELENYPLVLPPKSLQATILRESKKEEQLAKVREAGLTELIQQLKTDYIMEVRNRKHDMKTPMTQLRNTLPLLQSLSKSLPEAAAEKLNIYIQRQKMALDVLSSIVQHIADEEVFSDPEPVEIEPILKQYEEENDRYCVVYDRDEASFEESGIENPIINIGKVEFQRLVQNIIGNVIEHGFVDAENEGYGIHITLGIEDDNYVICFENNGEPFPEGMTKERYGTKGVKGKDSKGSGTGGYLVKSISQHYGGDFDIYTTAFAGFFNCGVIVKFPIYRNEQI